MILIPSLEIAGGQVVLRAGPAADAPAARLCDDPVRAARALRDAGAGFFHLVDLDALAGPGGRQLGEWRRFPEAGLPCQVGGGIRSPADARALLELGVDRLVVGSVLLTDDSAARAVVEAIGPQRLVASIDLVGHEVWTDDRSTRSGMELGTALERLADLGAPRVVLTQLGDDLVEREGPDLEVLDRALERRGDLELFVACRIRGKLDLAALAERAARGLSGAVLAGAYRAVAHKAQV